MKIYLASFLEPNNFGPGKLIGIANGKKPDYIRCDNVFAPLIPTNEIMKNYNSMRIDNPDKATEIFVSSFKLQLEKFVKEVSDEVKSSDKTPQEILPFKDGDTLACWERESFANYRGYISECLKYLGFEVELH